jgi:choline dehydrogenase-like flavoprotein
MGKVVDTDFKVKVLKRLRVVDASAYPVPITGHLQAVTYAMAQKSAEIVGGVRTQGGSARKIPPS